LNEQNENRNNGNRLFDSQNNAKGGYCTNIDKPSALNFYEGSLLSIEWTNQHGCGNPKLECNMILQYTCGQTNDDLSVRIRNGLTTDTIPDDVAQSATDSFGMHESYAYYQDCKTRSRNKGLFIADRNLNGNSAIFTRQNNNGNRQGFECPEERDYYPYWHPTPFKDIAVLTDRVDTCAFIKANSQNVVAKNRCVLNGVPQAENNEIDCNAAQKQWVSEPAWNISAPECLEAPWTRDNHLGNAVNGFAATYNWTIPADKKGAVDSTCSCVFRIRYNISSTDIQGWGADAADSKLNGKASPLKNNANKLVTGFNLTMAFNTNQYARTFQDRTHTFGILPRPAGVSALNRIYNLGVRGKRGNIVQTYPATEYDFIPEILNTRVGDYVHFQWTGCDNNPQNNAGEGTAGTDRSNIVQIEDISKNFPLTDQFLEENPGKALFDTFELRQSLAFLDQDVNKCPTLEQLLAKNNNNKNQVNQDKTNCFKLNAASPLQNFGLIRANKTGLFSYMSTRNNNFSNRGQKGQINTVSVLPAWGIAVVSVGAVSFVGAAGLAGATLYSKRQPSSNVASFMKKITYK